MCEGPWFASWVVPDLGSTTVYYGGSYYLRKPACLTRVSIILVEHRSVCCNTVLDGSCLRHEDMLTKVRPL